MKTLIVDDDFTNRLLLQEILKNYGAAHIAVNGKEAVEAVESALDANQPYDLICLDIMMPKMDGQEALRRIRVLEKVRHIRQPNRARIVMTTALGDKTNILKSVQEQCDYFMVKPIDKAKLLEELRNLKLIP